MNVYLAFLAASWSVLTHGKAQIYTLDLKGLPLQTSMLLSHDFRILIVLLNLMMLYHTISLILQA